MYKRQTRLGPPFTFIPTGVYVRATRHNRQDSAKLVSRREIRVPGDLMFGTPETQFQEPQNLSILSYETNYHKESFNMAVEGNQ